MGCCQSYCRSTSCKQDSVRLVHWNGYIEDFEEPVTVSQVTGKPPRHFVCTPAELLSTGSKPMKPDTLLERGRVYFLLPNSTFQADISPVDLSALVRKLMAKSKASPRNRYASGQTAQNSPRRNSDPTPLWDSPLRSFGLSPLQGISAGRGNAASSPVRNSPGRSPTRFLEPEMDVVARRSVGTRSWTPILDTIRERSFDRRSESDLQELFA